MDVLLPNTGFGSIIPCLYWPHTVTSDWKLAKDTPNSLGVCQKTGIIVNVRGIRGRTAEFFSGNYELHTESDDCEEVYITDSGVEAQSSQTLEMLKSSIVADTGRILEIGAAKGNFIKRFLTEFKGWEASAIEPSKQAAVSLARQLPQVDLHTGTLDTYSNTSQLFDVIVSNFVIAHLEDPFSFVETIGRLSKPGGLVLIGSPNFKNNPLDQFTTDHLSRFTPLSLKAIFAHYGFEELKMWADNRVPMWGLYRYTEVQQVWPLNELISEAYGLFAAHTRYAAQLFEAAQWIVDKADGKSIAVYGLSAAPLIAGCYTGFSTDRIGAFFDDNHFLHGSKRLGKEILSLDRLKSDGYQHLFISANPVYVERMKAKAHAAAPDCNISHP